MGVPEWLSEAEETCCLRHREAVPGRPVDWPSWFPAGCRASLAAQGITRPWSHQVELAEAAFTGRHAAICTPTSSGKSLAYLMPVLAATACGPDGVVGCRTTDLRSRLGIAEHTALYLAPTKALAHDQYRAARELGPQGWSVATLDGDSTDAERRFARDRARFLLTNPDMLHHTVLPQHARWIRFLSGLRYIIIDESHRYRGVFGAQVSAVIRRLRRLCALHGAEPTVILASATAGDAGRSGALLIGEPEPLLEVRVDGSPQAARDVLLRRPLDSPAHDAAEVMARLVEEDRQVITFVPSRTQAELIALQAQRRAGSGHRILSYRSGYLSEERRTIEAGLQRGEIAGVAATNALELGVDIAGMDAVLIAGFPGTLAALWQQAGRAGRAGREGLVVLLQGEDPLDAYLFDHPELIFDTPVEATALDVANPWVLAPQLAAAAQECPLTEADERWFGPTMADLADQLQASGLLRRRSTGWHWVRPERAADSINLRGSGGRLLDIIDEDSGRVIGQVDGSAADRTVHQGAVYLHQGDQWLVQEYRPQDNQAVVRAGRPGYFTQATSLSQIQLVSTSESRRLGAGLVSTGQVLLTEQVTGYLRRDELTGKVWDQTPLELPEHTMTTQATWWTIPQEVTAGLDLSAIRLAGAAHAAEHTAIGLLPMFVTCDRWDIGGLSTLLHPDTGQCTIIVHDAHPGGAGIARRGYDCAEPWTLATLNRLRRCPCQTGCPACVVSPKCGNANQVLDKQAAILLLAALLAD